jgi:hypothetical protein
VHHRLELLADLDGHGTSWLGLVASPARVDECV